jgi:glyoxylase-like metal-dependent hydrolase (beta-lactamase superfamily II)
MRLQQFILGEMQVNTYLLWDEETLEAACLDPGGPPEELLTEIKDKKLKLKYIILTHGHYDHIGGVNTLQENTGALVAVHTTDAALLTNPALNLSSLFGQKVIVKADQLLSDGEVLCLGANMLKTYHTPGHTQGSMVIHGSGILFSGDTLFAGSVGRTDLPTGNQSTLNRSLRKLLQFHDGTRVFPGHGPDTNLGQEKRNNPFLQPLVAR